MPRSKASFLNALEREVWAKYQKDGWSVLRNGWPDFLLVNGPHLVGVEVKGSSDCITPSQHLILSALSQKFPIIHAKEGLGYGSTFGVLKTFHELIYSPEITDHELIGRQYEMLREMPPWVLNA